METTAYQVEQSNYLLVKGSLVTLVAVFISIVTYFLRTTENGDSAVFTDLAQTPLLILAIVGIGALVAILTSNRGRGLSGTVFIYGIVTLIISLTALWAFTTTSTINEAKYDWKVTKFSPETIAWFMLAFVLLVFMVLTYLRGEMRVDMLGANTAGGMAFVSFAIIFSLLLAKLFELVIQSLKLFEFAPNSLGFSSFYLAAVVGVIVLVFTTIQVLNATLTFVSGNWDKTFIAPPNADVREMVKYTRVAYHASVVAMVLITAALVWRKSRRLDEKQTDAKQLKKQWSITLVFFLAAPLIAIFAELLKDVRKFNPFVYSVLQTLVFSAIVLLLGMNTIEWSRALGIFAIAMIILGTFVYFGTGTFKFNVLFALFLGFVFAVALDAFRPSESDTVIEREEKWLSIAVPVTLVALTLAVAIDTAYYGVFPSAAAGVMGMAMIAYTTVSKLYFKYANLDKMDIYPENQTASMIYNTLLMGCILLVLGNIAATMRAFAKFQMDGKKGSNLSSLVLTPLMGLGAASAFHLLHTEQTMVFDKN